MSIAIVTKRCFLICEDIISITLQEQLLNEYEEPPLKVKVRNLIDRLSNRLDKRFFININYMPPALANNRGGGACCGSMNMQIEVRGYREAYDLYSEVVREVREQKPDQRYLDSLVEKMFGMAPEGTVR